MDNEYADKYKMDFPGGFTTLITGDSLSYNRYDFDPLHRENAYECYPGIRSWSFLLRDRIYSSDPLFKFGDEVSVRCSFGVTAGTVPMSHDEIRWPFGGRVLSIKPLKKEDEITLSFNREVPGDKVVLYLLHNPEGSACSFDVRVNGAFRTRIDNNGEGKSFQGYEPFGVELDIGENHGSFEVSFSRFERSVPDSDTGDMCVYLTGAGSRHAPVHLSGKGGMTAGFFVRNIDDRILKYSPDLFIFIVGANDAYYSTPEQFRTDLIYISDTVKNSCPNVKILLVSTPRMSGKPDELVDKFVGIMEEVAGGHGCGFVSLPRLFEGIPAEKWRFDNVHFTRWGNEMVFRKVLETLKEML